MKAEYFSFDVTEYCAALTMQHQQTLGYLLGKGYITGEQYDEVMENTMVTTMRPNVKFGRRLIEKFFRKGATEDSYTFMIVEIPQIWETTKKPDSPNLKMVVDND